MYCTKRMHFGSHVVVAIGKRERFAFVGAIVGIEAFEGRELINGRPLGAHERIYGSGAI